MTDIVLVALIAAIPSTIVGVATLISSGMNKAAIKDVHVSINSRMSQFLEEARKLGFAKGSQMERDKTAAAAAVAVTAAAST